MLIKFIKPDPRAGSTAKMDSHRGQQLVDSGAAIAIGESAKPAPASSHVATPPAPKATRRRAAKAEQPGPQTPQAQQTPPATTAESDLLAAAATTASGTPGEGGHARENLDAYGATVGTDASTDADTDADTAAGKDADLTAQ